MKQKDFETVLSELLIPESEWVGAAITKLPPGVLELLKAYQDAKLRRDGPGNKPNLKEAVTWLAAVALADGDAAGKITALGDVSEDWVKAQRRKRQAEYQQKKRAALAV